MIIVGVLAVLFLFYVIVYNNLISKVNQIKNAEGALDATLKQRYDLIPNLVEIAKQYMDHEDKMFTKIIELRTRAQSAGSINDTINANKELDKSLKGFMMTVENYPTLLSNQNFLQIQSSLTDLEENIAASRRFFNASVVAYNESIQMIPGNLLAPMMKLYPREVYSIPESEKSAPDMKQLFKK